MRRDAGVRYEGRVVGAAVWRSMLAHDIADLRARLAALEDDDYVGLRRIEEEMRAWRTELRRLIAHTRRQVRKWEATELFRPRTAERALARWSGFLEAELAVRDELSDGLRAIRAWRKWDREVTAVSLEKIERALRGCR